MPDADRDGEGEGLGGVDAWPPCLGSIELVWRRLNRSHDLARFLRSDVRWAECDARLEPGGSIVISHSAGDQGDRPFAEWLWEVADAGRRAKVDLKESGPVLEGVLEAIADTDGLRGERLWFNAAIEVVGGSAGLRSHLAGGSGRAPLAPHRQPRELAPRHLRPCAARLGRGSGLGDRSRVRERPNAGLPGGDRHREAGRLGDERVGRVHRCAAGGRRRSSPDVDHRGSRPDLTHELVAHSIGLISWK